MLRSVDLGLDFYGHRAESEPKSCELVRQLTALGHEITLARSLSSTA